jgi:oligoendopeptidase F
MTTATTTDFVPAELDGSSWEALQPLYQALIDRSLNCVNCLEQLLLDRSELDAAAAEAHANLYIAMTCHTDDEAAKQGYLDFVENVSPKLRRVGFELDQKIVECPHKADLDTRRYEVLLRDLQADVEIYRDENVPLMTQDTKLGQQYSETCGAMAVEFDGEERTLPQMGRYLEETDRQVRQGAWRAVAERRFQDCERLDGLLDEMIQLRHSIGRNAGFDNFRDYAFKSKHRFDYTPADCTTFLQAVQEVCVPVYRQLNTERAEALDVDTLRPWDLAVDIKGRSPLRPFANADELIEKTSKLFHRMDSGLGKMFDSMRTGDCLDLDSRKGKAPGGYQELRTRSRTPFIFMNAAGLQRDLETMVHEAGHAFHSLLCSDDPLLHYRWGIPLEFCEVASMSMELLSFPYLDEFYDECDVARSKRHQLESMASMLPWIATIDAFQHWMYTHPEHSREERAAAWVELDERLGPAVSWAGMEQLRETTWQRQLHLFEVPFYYIEYGIAQLGALQLWLIAIRDEQAALKRYRSALSLGGSRPLPELFAAAGLEFDFGTDTVKRLMDEVQQQLEKLPR